MSRATKTNKEPRLSDAQRRVLSCLETGPLFYSNGRWHRRGVPGAHPSVVTRLIDRGLVRRIEQRCRDGRTIVLCRLVETLGEGAS